MKSLFCQISYTFVVILFKETIASFNKNKHSKILHCTFFYKKIKYKNIFTKTFLNIYFVKFSLYQIKRII